MRPVILYRDTIIEEAELAQAKLYFPTYRERSAIQKDDLVIGRYSALPYYNELQNDCDYTGATLINTLKQHRYIADLRNWVEDLRELTPKTWYRLEEVDEEGPYVLKGKTNSRKFDWKTHMFAADRAAAAAVSWRLSTDGLIGGENQDIYIRKFVPLKTYFLGINDLPVTKEFRFFTAYGRVLCGAFYWDNYADDMEKVPVPGPREYEFVETVLKRIGDRANGVVIDVAETETGELMVVELNDLQMSGLSRNDPETLYKELNLALSFKFHIPMDQHLGAYVYCHQHLGPHTSGWCTVSITQKTALSAQTREDAVKECREKGLKLYDDIVRDKVT